MIGAGPNGLVAGNLLADAGWDVTVLEAQPVPGGAVRSDEITRPGFVSDLFSAFYPLAAGSPILAGLDLEAYGLRWRHSPAVLAHPFPDGSCALLSRDLEQSAASVSARGRRGVEGDVLAVAKDRSSVGSHDTHSAVRRSSKRIPAFVRNS